MSDETLPTPPPRMLPLHPQHQALGARFQELHGWQVPRNYGDPVVEYYHVRRHAGLLDLSYRSRLRLTGKDRRDFLQGMVSNDVNLPVAAGTYACFLDAGGHVMADLKIYARPDYYLLDLEPQAGDPTRTKLEFYVILSDVTITDIGTDYAILAVNGPQSRPALSSVFSQPLPPLQDYSQWEGLWEGEGVLVVKTSITGEEGYDLWVPAGAAPAFWDSLQHTVQQFQGGAVGYEALETLRVETGIPRLGADLDDRTIPQEAGLDRVAVSFSKGCYIGQETVARLDARGSNVYRRLRGLEIQGSLIPSPGAPILAGDREVGKITTAVYSPLHQQVIALAYVHRGHNEAGTFIQVRDGEAMLAARVVEIPFSGDTAREDPQG